jgi:alcohol dehydrogenase class IV
MSEVKTYIMQTAGKIVSGAGSLSTLGGHLPVISSSIKSALIITQESMKKRGLTDELSQQLQQKHISISYLTDVLPEPTADNIRQMHEKIKHEHYDVLIGIGGGSVLDATKLLSVLATNQMDVEQMLGTDMIQYAGIPTVLIPTTSGTGSEVTPNAIVTIPQDELKIGAVSRYLLPQLVIIDPLLTLGLPKFVTASTGMDAFTHALESYISNKANYLSDMFALESIRLISSSIINAFHHGSSVEAREKMIIGSMYGGMALTCAGTAAVHAMAYPIGGKFNVPHGVANSMLLPHVMRFNLDSIDGRLTEVAKVMDLHSKTGSSVSLAEKVIIQIEEWTKELEIPQDLTLYGVKNEDVAALAVSASKVTRLMNNNPKAMTLEEIEKVYYKLLP